MAKALPKKWFPEDVAVIKFRAPRMWDDHPQILAKRFETWAEAHEYMLDRAAQQIERAKKDLASAERHLKKVLAMTAPTEGGADA